MHRPTSAMVREPGRRSRPPAASAGTSVQRPLSRFAPAARAQFRNVSGLTPRSAAAHLIVAPGRDWYSAMASALNSGGQCFMTTRCPISDPQDPCLKCPTFRSKSHVPQRGERGQVPLPVARDDLAVLVSEGSLPAIG